MRGTIQLTQEIDDLQQIHYQLTMIDNTVYLDIMHFAERPTKKHKYRIDQRKSYSRLNKRDYGIKDEPEVPIEISAEAVRIFRQMINFKPWKDRK